MDTLPRSDDALELRYAAHDLRHLFGVVRGHAEFLAAESDDPQVSASLQAILGAADQAYELFEDVLRFGAAGPRETGKALAADVDVALASVRASGTRPGHPDAPLEIEASPELGQVAADQGDLNRALLNLVWNAYDALPEVGGQVALRAQSADGWVWFEVEDNGPGLPPAYQGDLTALVPAGEGRWERDEHGELHGFGMMLIALVARRSGGRFVGAARADGPGARLRLGLPLVRAESA